MWNSQKRACAIILPLFCYNIAIIRIIVELYTKFICVTKCLRWFFRKWTENGRLLLSSTFTAKCELVFSWHRKTFIRKGFILKLTERTYVRLQNRTRALQHTPPFKRSTYFYVTILYVFITNFKTTFLKN